MTDYREQLAQNAEANYQRFYDNEIHKTREDIYNNAYQISFYCELQNYLTGSHDLEDGLCKFLCEDGNGVIDILYKEYLDNEFASIASWDDVSDFIRRYCETYDPNYGKDNEPKAGIEM